jgi:Ca-activated chloride channel family protein
MKNNNAVKLAIIAVAVFALIFAVVSATQNWGKDGDGIRSRDEVDKEAALKKLDNLYSQLHVNKPTPKKDPNYQDMDDSAQKTAVLPDISEYPFVVNPTTNNFLTVYASLDKIEWMIDVAAKFNQSGTTVDGSPVSVGVRAIPSSLGAEFISSGKYKPDVYAPANEIYGSMLTAQGVNANLLEKRIAGNLSGVVINKKKNDDLVSKYGSLNSTTIINAVLGGELALGYTSPLSDEDGFNFILTLLSEADSGNPVSENAIDRLRKFQDKIPFISYDNDQLTASLTGGTLDAIVLNYQRYANSPGLKASYVFVPIGTRKDNPVYEIGELTGIKKQMAAKFAEFCKNANSQNSATEKGCNNLNEYAYTTSISGTTILEAREIYKKEKGGSSDITAVFVADISGSMEGSPLLNLKASLNRAMGVIDADTNVGLVTFSDSVSIAVPIGKFDNTQKSYFSNAVRSMSAGGGTAMFDAIVVAQKMLVDAKARNPNTKLMLFVLTDGETNRGYTFEDVEDVLIGTKIPVYTIGYNADIEVLKEISDINEAATMDADSDNVIYRLESLFNAQI